MKTYNGELGQFLVERKYNGINLTIQKGRAFKRGNSSYLNCWDSIPAHIQAMFSDIHIPIVGELYCPAHETASEAIKKANAHKLAFVAHGVGDTVKKCFKSWGDLRIKLDDIFGLAIPQLCPLSEIEVTKSEHVAIWTKHLLKEAVDKGYEGWVLKQLPYGECFKLKPVKTADLLVTGYTEGKGKYAGMVGALVCAAYTDMIEIPVEVCRCSGMLDDTRRCIDESWIGKIVEVAYQEIGTNGRLIMPRFIRVRDDKTKPDFIEMGEA